MEEQYSAASLVEVSVSLYVVKEDPDVFLLQEEVGVSPHVMGEEPDVFLVKVVE